MKPIVTREAVESAIKKIKERGERVTIERIRAITGGSPKTIGNIRNAIDGNTMNGNTLPLFGNKATGLSYHKVEKQIDDMIMKRVNTIVVKRVATVLARLEGTEEVEEGPQPKQSDESETLTEALGEMRELWLDAYGLFSVAEQEIIAVDKDFAQLEKKSTAQITNAYKELDTAQERIVGLEEELSATHADNLVKKKRVAELEKQNEGSSRTEKGQRVFKDELALAIHYLVMTAGLPQKEIADLLGISSSEVSKFKNRGTKLRQKK